MFLFLSMPPPKLSVHVGEEELKHMKHMKYWPWEEATTMRVLSPPCKVEVQSTSSLMMVRERGSRSKQTWVITQPS